MADLSNVFSALKSAAIATLFPPAGAIPANGLSPIAGSLVEVGDGWPTADDLDIMAASLERGGTPLVIISVYVLPGHKTTTRYPRRWQDMKPGVTTLTATVDPGGTVVTIGGTVSSPQNVAVIANDQTFAYAVVPDDTLESIANNLVKLIAPAMPASATGPAIWIPGAYRLVARTGYVTTAGEEVMREMRRFLVSFWAPSPDLRDAVSTPVKTALAVPHFLALDDGSAARIVLCGDMLNDLPQKAGVYRRDLNYDVEYATFLTAPGPEAISAGGIIESTYLPLDQAVEQTETITTPTEVGVTQQPPWQSYIELGISTSWSLSNGTVFGQRVLIVDNLLLASPNNPIAIYGYFNVGSSIVLNQPGQAIEPFWNGSQWIVPTWIGAL